MAKKNLITIRDVVFINYNKATNMTLKELINWSKNPLSKKVSQNRKPIMMAIRLKKKPKNKWGLTEIKWALKKAIPFLKKAKKTKGRTPVKGTTHTRKQLILKNWGFDVRKKNKQLGR